MDTQKRWDQRVSVLCAPETTAPQKFNVFVILGGTVRQSSCTQLNNEADFRLYIWIKRTDLASHGRISREVVSGYKHWVWGTMVDIFCTYCQYSYSIHWGRLCHHSEAMESVLVMAMPISTAPTYSLRASFHSWKDGITLGKRLASTELYTQETMVYSEHSEVPCYSVSLRLKCGIFISIGFLSSTEVKTHMNPKGFLVPHCNSPSPLPHSQQPSTTTGLDSPYSNILQNFYQCGIKGCIILSCLIPAIPHNYSEMYVCHFIHQWSIHFKCECMHYRLFSHIDRQVEDSCF